MNKFPFYKGSVDAAKRVRPGRNAPVNTGLWFTRFYSGFNENWEVGEKDKHGWIDETVRQGPSGNGEQITHLLGRQRKLCEALGGKVAELQTQGNFVTGTGLSHPVENGFTFHPTLGIPYLPASGVKGLLRGWVEEWMPHASDAEKKARIARWFGAAKGSDKDTDNESEEGAGSFIFFDALPSKPVNLGCDVMTPHMGKWYEKGADYTARDEATTAPADWHSPVPVPFLVVKAATDFNFMIAPRTIGNAQVDAQTLADLPTVMQALKDALEWLGAGAKTATGYGRMVQTREAMAREAERQVQAQREKAMTGKSEQGKLIEALRHKCAELDANITGGNFKKQAPEAGKAGLYQDALTLSKKALESAEWTTDDKRALADMLEQWLPRVIGPWDAKEQRKKLKLAALRGLA